MAETALGVKKNGVFVGARKELNLIEGSNITITVTDSATVPNQVDITIESA